MGACQAALRAALETGSLDLEDRGLSSLGPALFEDERTLASVTRAKLSGNKLKVLLAHGEATITRG